MSIVNKDKPTTSLANNSKVSIGETWATITTTWATETRSWLAVSQLITNRGRFEAGSMWLSDVFPWTEDYPWLTVGGITNIAKPS